MSQMTEVLAETGKLSLKNLFIDGTKIEAAANKYSFVWKKSVTKNQQKVLDKIPAFILKTEKDFGIRVLYKDIVKIHHLKKLRKKLKKIQKEENIINTSILPGIEIVFQRQIMMQHLCV